MALDVFDTAGGKLLTLAELARRLAAQTGQTHTAELLKGWAKPTGQAGRPRLAVVLIGTVWHSTEAAVREYLDQATQWRLRGPETAEPTEKPPPPSRASARAAAELEREWAEKPRGRKRRRKAVRS